MGASRAAGSDQHKIARIVAALHRYAKRVGDRLDRLASLLPIERQSASEQSFGIEVAKDKIGVGDGRLRAALPITGGPRRRPGTVRTDLQQAHAVDPTDRAAAGAKRLD